MSQRTRGRDIGRKSPHRAMKTTDQSTSWSTATGKPTDSAPLGPPRPPSSFILPTSTSSPILIEARGFQNLNKTSHILPQRESTSFLPCNRQLMNIIFQFYFVSSIFFQFFSQFWIILFPSKFFSEEMEHWHAIDNLLFVFLRSLLILYPTKQCKEAFMTLRFHAFSLNVNAGCISFAQRKEKKFSIQTSQNITKHRSRGTLRFSVLELRSLPPIAVMCDQPTKKCILYFEWEIRYKDSMSIWLIDILRTTYCMYFSWWDVDILNCR